MVRLTVSEDQLYALDEALAFYALFDYGNGEERPLGEGRAEHTRLIEALRTKVESTLKGVEVNAR